LGESNLFLISSSGAADASFNEFNPLFYRDQLTLQASGIAGDDDTMGGEAVVSGIYKKASLSVGYSHFETDGFRINNDQEDEFVNVFGQVELSPKTSIQAEYRYRDSDRGFLQLRFEPDDFLTDYREMQESDSVRLGIRHAFSPGSQLIGNFTYQEKDYIDQKSVGSPPVNLGDSPFVINLEENKFDDEAYSGELQYLFRSENSNVVAGAGYFDIDQQKTYTSDTDFYPPLLPPPPFPPYFLPFPINTTSMTPSETGAEHINYYLYSNINLLKSATLTLAASGDNFDSESSVGPDVDQFNPKVGLIWNPHPNTTLRGAAFRVLKRKLITDQTLEPTQVAGFNQFFDDADGTSAWRYCGAIDQKFSKNFYGGAEYSQRDLEVRPFGTPGIEADWDEKLIRAYLFFTPFNWLGLSAEYVYEEFNREIIFDGAENVETNYALLGIKFFSSYGLSVSLNGTFVDQKGDFQRFLGLGTTPGEDDFWLLDASISYRLPKRYGTITLGAKNLLDEEFQYFDTDRDNPRIIPDTFYFVKLTLAVP
jgi:hypothetical protein